LLLEHLVLALHLEHLVLRSLLAHLVLVLLLEHLVLALHLGHLVLALYLMWDHLQVDTAYLAGQPPQVHHRQHLAHCT